MSPGATRVIRIIFSLYFVLGCFPVSLRVYRDFLSLRVWSQLAEDCPDVLVYFKTLQLSWFAAKKIFWVSFSWSCKMTVDNAESIFKLQGLSIYSLIFYIFALIMVNIPCNFATNKNEIHSQILLGQTPCRQIGLTYLHTGQRQDPRSQLSCRYDSRSKHWMCLQSWPLAGSTIFLKVIGHLSDTCSKKVSLSLSYRKILNKPPWGQSALRRPSVRYRRRWTPSC